VGSAVCDFRRIDGFTKILTFSRNFGSSFPEK
jgi:hypothetical protein